MATKDVTKLSLNLKNKQLDVFQAVVLEMTDYRNILAENALYDKKIEEQKTLLEKLKTENENLKKQNSELTFANGRLASASINLNAENENLKRQNQSLSYKNQSVYCKLKEVQKVINSMV